MMPRREEYGAEERSGFDERGDRSLKSLKCLLVAFRQQRFLGVVEERKQTELLPAGEVVCHDVVVTWGTR